MKMTIYIFIVILLGILCGYFVLPDVNLNITIDVILSLTIFFIGIGIGQNKHIFKKLKQTGLKILALPLGTIIGSLCGGFLAGILLKRSLTLSLAIASGFGWYSLSAGLLLPVGGETVATIGFLTNVFREMIAFLIIPFVARKISPFSAISIGGATSMDTTLPIISRSTSEEYVLISFIHGVLLSLTVPIFVQFFASL